jgi:hypothetical protein
VKKKARKGGPTVDGMETNADEGCDEKKPDPDLTPLEKHDVLAKLVVRHLAVTETIALSISSKCLHGSLRGTRIGCSAWRMTAPAARLVASGCWRVIGTKLTLEHDETVCVFPHLNHLNLRLQTRSSS